MRYLSRLAPSDFKNKICLLRLDFNTEDNWRILASLPALKFLTVHCRAVVILSHKGRPAGFEKLLSLKRYSAELKKLIGKPVVFISHFRFGAIKNLVSSSPRGSVFLLENLRFLKGESENNPALAKRLSSLGDFYVNEAFAVSHRANASVTAIAGFLPSYAGFGLEAEIKNLSQTMKNPKKPLTVILGGLKIEDKLKVYRNLKNKASVFLIGGALDSKILKKLSKMKKIVLPADFKYEKRAIRDIGLESVKIFRKEIKKAGTIIWNGPLGNINKKKFENGTRAIAKVASANKKAFKLVGGGETVMYLKKLKLDKKFDFVSTGGGAMLSFLAGKTLPGLKVLK